MARVGAGLDRRAVLAAGPCGAVSLALLSSALSGGAARAATSAAALAPAWGTVLVPPREPFVVPAGARLVRPVVPTLAGSALRVELSNRYGAEPLALAGMDVVAGARREAVRFAGEAGCTIPPGAAVLSDPVAFPVERGARIDLAARFPDAVSLADTDRRASLPGWMEDAAGGRSETAESALFSTLYVEPAAPARVIALIGDTKSAGPGTWPEMLPGLLPAGTGILNRSLYAGHLALGPAGLSALARLERDVLAVPGLTDVLLFAGNNDLIQPGMIGSSGAYSLDPSQMLSTGDLVGYLTLAARRMRAAGLRVGAATWLPYEGVTIAQDYSTPEKQRIRDEVNAWLRGTDEIDWLVDFDAALRAEADPHYLDPRYDEGNHFTPNEAGYALMASTFAAALAG